MSEPGDGLRILVCPDKFRGSITAEGAAAALAQGLSQSLPGAEVAECPVSDGGDGFARLLARHLDLDLVTRKVTGPLGGEALGELVMMGDGCAAVDMASASGLALLSPEERDPLRATSRGTGEIIRWAVEQGCDKVILGVGGSATVDGGAGAASALGLVLRDRDGNRVADGGAALGGVTSLDTADLAFRPGEVDLVVAADVVNTLLGSTGAAAVYGPQKGADPEGVILLERGLDNLAERIDKHRWGLGAPPIVSAWPTQIPGFPDSRASPDYTFCGRRLTAEFREYDAPLALVPGTGSAGGMAVALCGIFGARVARGTSAFLDLVRFDERFEGFNVMVTGEGSFDGGTRFGKAAWEVLERRKGERMRRIAACGTVDPAVIPEAVRAFPGLEIFSLDNDLGLERSGAMEDAGKHLTALGGLVGDRLSAWAETKKGE